MSQETMDIQSAARLARLIELSRGIHHGIALGDAADQLTSGEPVRRSGVVTQLTLATTEGMIRTMERAGRGLGVDWGHENLQALRRWGVAQGIPGIAPGRGASPSLLTGLPGYGVRRGSAPATVRALAGGPTAASAPGHASLGPHALVRTLPCAVLLLLHGPAFTEPIPELVGTTHRHPLPCPPPQPVDCSRPARPIGPRHCTPLGCRCSTSTCRPTPCLGRGSARRCSLPIRDRATLTRSDG